MKQFVSFLDGYPMSHGHVIKSKSDIFLIFVNYFHLVENQHRKNIKRVRSNNGTKYVNNEFSKFWSLTGIAHELKCVNTTKQNRVVEKKNHHLLKVARALFFQMPFLKTYQGEVVLTTTCLINRFPTCVLNGMDAIKCILSFVHSSPLVSTLSLVFGCVAFIHSHNHNCNKLDLIALKYVFTRGKNVINLRVILSLSQQMSLIMKLNPFYKSFA